MIKLEKFFNFLREKEGKEPPLKYKLIFEPDIVEE